MKIISVFSDNEKIEPFQILSSGISSTMAVTLVELSPLEEQLRASVQSLVRSVSGPT